VKRVALACVLAAVLEAQSPQEAAAASQRESILRQQQSVEVQARSAAFGPGDSIGGAAGREASAAAVAAQLASVERQQAALTLQRGAAIPSIVLPAARGPGAGQADASVDAGPLEQQGGADPVDSSLARQLRSIAQQPRPSWPEPPEPVSQLACAPLTPAVLAPIFDRAASAYALESSLLRAVARKESAFHPCAVSRAGAVGLMQLMPETAATLGVADPFDAEQNIFAGAQFLRFLLDRFQNDLGLALSAYNAGPSRVERHRGIPPIPETQDYVMSILRSLGRPPPE
jgi:soluble lytic murein transglycosylase-like protein